MNPLLSLLLDLLIGYIGVFISILLDVLVNIRGKGLDDKYPAYELVLLKFDLLPIVAVWLTQEDVEQIISDEDALEGDFDILEELRKYELFQLFIIKIVDKIHYLYNHECVIRDEFLLCSIDTVVERIYGSLQTISIFLNAVALENAADVVGIEDVCLWILLV